MVIPPDDAIIPKNRKTTTRVTATRKKPKMNPIRKALEILTLGFMAGLADLGRFKEGSRSVFLIDSHFETKSG
jgi:hypothetical protein